MMANITSKIKRPKISKDQKKIKRTCMQAQHNVVCAHLMLEHPKDQLTLIFVMSYNSQ
jgi:hypothetical protein